MEQDKMKEDSVIRVENLSYTYEGNDRKALDGISLEIGRGRKVAFMGGNGSGKSTFFLCLNGLLRPREGRILIDGQPIRYTRKGLLEVRKKVGIVFQEPDNQLFSASVYQEISFGILNLGADEQTARREVEHVIAELGIAPFQDRPAHALSGGQKKQVAIADILVMHPEIIILDEPAAALDPEHTEIVHRIVDDLTGQGITVLMSTHDIDYALGWADEIVLMHEGKVLRKDAALSVCMDREALETAHLREPSVLRLFRNLTEKKILKEGRKPPKTMGQLESYLSGE
ncbi:energy-coupling factor ABC transporter ATP-binding protein [Lachnoclostridium sp. An169]|uniref:energy-coupling factor ABC transporter ATP-binding protein n=1 Tax=Lachnoclostridium sp. An169 TaxID=1965569 RepID=UPI001FA860B8|nr:ABC transporter ATP-binding protein [Lachnoclostridium sp. An169]